MDDETVANKVPLSLSQTPEGAIVVQFGPFASIMDCTMSQVFIDHIQKFKPVEKCEACLANEKLVESGTFLEETPLAGKKPTIH